MERNVVQYHARAVVTETDVFKSNVAFDWRKRDGASRITVFGRLVQNFLRTFETSKRFRELGADLHNLHYRRDQESHEHGVSEKLADGHRSCENLTRPYIHNDRAYRAQQNAGGESHD